MATARIAGLPLDDRADIMAAGHDPEEVLGKAVVAFFKQVFRDGFFHGDLHPGNLFVQADGTIGAVDFGIMGRLDKATRRHLGELLLSFLGRDYRRAAEIHFEAGWVPRHKSVETFTQACRSIAEPILDRPQNEISMARLLAQLFQVTETFQMETQPQLLLLQKTMLVAEGTGRKLAPEANMWLLARPLIEDWMSETLTPEIQVRETVESMASALRRLPHLLDGVQESASMIASGRVKLHPDTIGALRAGPNPGRPPATPWLWIVALVFIMAVMLVM